MAYFVRLVSFTSEGSKDVMEFPNRRKEFFDAAKKLNIDVVAEYVLAGRYDILTILKAPDLESVLKLSAVTGSSGRTRSETLSAIPAADFEKILKAA